MCNKNMRVLVGLHVMDDKQDVLEVVRLSIKWRVECYHLFVLVIFKGFKVNGDRFLFKLYL